MSLRRLLTACVCGALLALPVAASAQQAQDDDEDTFEQKIIKNILGGMGVDVGRPGIDYRERSPLVIPPTRDLPPPQAAGTATSPDAASALALLSAPILAGELRRAGLTVHTGRITHPGFVPRRQPREHDAPHGMAHLESPSR